MENRTKESDSAVSGQFVDRDGERFYKISDVDQMSPFFISVVSASNHWFFISSTGALSAGRVRPENALFPYRSVDHIHESAHNTGAKTIIKVVQEGGASLLWEPYNEHHDGRYEVQRNLYKNSVGDKIIFEEVNHSLALRYQYSWSCGETFGFVRETEITNLSQTNIQMEVIDGIQNLLPSGAPLQALQTRSALVDAYKWNERVDDLPMATYSMYAKLSDRAEPAESLRTTTAFSITDNDADILLSAKALGQFRKGLPIQREQLTRGERGAYFVHQAIALKPAEKKAWLMVADIDKTHVEVDELRQSIHRGDDLLKLVHEDVARNQLDLVTLMSGADAWQLTSNEETSVHHYANVLFNNMRGGVFVSGYHLDAADVMSSLKAMNSRVFERHTDFIASLNANFTHPELMAAAKATGDDQLVRLCYEYLPLTFGRRHGDPSRPWNHFEIKVRDDEGNRLLAYQGNWRDIFQNWEAMALSYPHFIGSFIAKFVNASTVDGYNPYRITKEGVDWELLELDDPWSNIGYWGDHQIIYLLKFLELADKYHHNDLTSWLSDANYSYANVPYELCNVEGLLANPKDTVSFNTQKQQLTEELSATLGSDGRLLLDSNGEVYQVNLLEKLLVPLLSKLSNFVLDGGIWLNTQRPEWNDANNAIVGNGLSMVTLYYIRRYVTFLRKLVCKASMSVELSNEVSTWLLNTNTRLKEMLTIVRSNDITPELRKQMLVNLEESADAYRQRVYADGFSGKSNVDMSKINELLDVSVSLLDQSIMNNKRSDGLYNAYNILDLSHGTAEVAELYPMLEGQVAILSSGILDSKQAITLLDKLFASDMYREDQQSLMLYPDRALPSYLEKNQVSSAMLEHCELLQVMLAANDKRLVVAGGNQQVHFNADFENVGKLIEKIAEVKHDYPAHTEQDWEQIKDIYELTFNHKAFTGRSGTMFGYEGLGCIYWHMVSKLLLAVQENYQRAYLESPESEETAKLAGYYYRVREGIGFNKTPDVYGAFPTDPYSHTPKQAGAQQPGMTGQVKEEILTRFGELGIEITDGEIHISPTLLQKQEFITQANTFCYFDVEGKRQGIAMPVNSLAFTYCQVPFMYVINHSKEMSIDVEMVSGEVTRLKSATIPTLLSNAIFSRGHHVKAVTVNLPMSMMQ
ncbi:hypothetical protein MD535_10415 [Vibrio sp. ZSDZ65]|uniref:Cellobiose phosphorylase n=1 Tax=Vibrio qingdaonensis TaxID=2829491 RepID=A0A9X3CN66_9VIBR|nr:hypothetical protein [Vibrio qingdaonensis]MCW8346413.1 hypothetical protein [Vibrio qingdaonensis]